MMELTTTPLLPVRQDEPFLQEHYDLPLSEIEVYFLGGFIAYLLNQQMGQQLLLERAVVVRLYRRYADRWSSPKDCKLKLKAEEALALKRVLANAPLDLDPEGQVHRNNLLGKLQQQMARIN